MSNYQITYRSISGTTISQIIPANSLAQAASLGESRAQDDPVLKGFSVVKVVLTTEK